MEGCFAVFDGTSDPFQTFFDYTYGLAGFDNAMLSVGSCEYPSTFIRKKNAGNFSKALSEIVSTARLNDAMRRANWEANHITPAKVLDYLLKEDPEDDPFYATGAGTTSYDYLDHDKDHQSDVADEAVKDFIIPSFDDEFRLMVKEAQRESGTTGIEYLKKYKPLMYDVYYNYYQDESRDN